MPLIVPILSTDSDETVGSKTGEMKVTQHIARETQKIKKILMAFLYLI